MNEQGYDQESTSPTDVRTFTEDYWLTFNVPPGLMPDPQFDGYPAKLQVHRVYPGDANGKSVATHAVVLIHGRSVPGSVVFDLQFTDPDGNDLSVQKALAQAGIDTFAPSLLGYGRSTRFYKGLNDPANASLREYATDGTCQFPEGCDRTSNPAIFPPDQQGRQNPTMLWVNPLARQRRAHSSNFRFARTDVWVRDIDQVIEDAASKLKASTSPQKTEQVALVGYSLGGQNVGRTLYADNPNEKELLGKREDVIERVSSVVFVNSLFFPNQPTEESETGRPTFPLTLNDKSGSDANWTLPQGATDCEGRIIPGTQQQVWAQTMAQETLGLVWGGDDPMLPTGLNRAPTFSGYGWNRAVAGQMSTPTLVMQGLLDGVVPTGPGTGKAIFQALPASMTNKVLVQVECASHALPWEKGANATLKRALINWIKERKFNGNQTGSFFVDQSGGVRPET
jgi:pimeloyl-ACP methyl ester carboxylesterase